MNSNFSVTDGRGRSTPRLFSGSRSPSSVPGFPVRARAAAPAHSRSAAALRRHAHGGKRPPSYRGYPRLYRAPSPLWRSGATSRSPSSRLHPGIQERSSSSVEAITYLSRRPHYIGGTVRKPRGSSGSSCGTARVRPVWVCPRGRWVGLLVASFGACGVLGWWSKLGCPLDHQPAGVVGGGWVFGSSTRPYTSANVP